MNGLVQVQSRPPLGVITLNRPAKRNALSRGLIDEIAQAFDDLHQERKVRAIAITGAGSVFCAGMDLDEMLAASNEPNAWQIWQDDAVLYRDLIEKMLRFPKPIIAAVNGPAIAGGLGLVLASDLTLATSGAAIGLPEPRRGIVAGIVSPLLVFRAGGSYAARMLLTARNFSAAEALQMGLFHELVADDGLLARAAEVAGEIAASAPESMQLTKRMLNETIGETIFTQLSAGAAASATARTTNAANEGLSAFLEKREPKWD